MSEANRNFHILIVYHYALYHGIIIYTMLLECQCCVHLSHSSLVGWPTCWWIVWSSERPDKQLHSYCGEEIPATRNSVLFPDPERTPTKKVPRRQYDIWLGPMVLMSGMWDGQSEFSYIAFFFCVDKVDLNLLTHGHTPQSSGSITRTLFLIQGLGMRPLWSGNHSVLVKVM